MSDFPAMYTVHWPSGPVHACATHASQLRGLAGFLGAHVGFTAAPYGAQCANCENAAKVSAEIARNKEQGDGGGV